MHTVDKTGEKSKTAKAANGTAPGVTDTRSQRPEKPRPDFPLFPHASGRWAKKVRGNLCYFGKWSDDPKGERAVNQWLDEKDDLLAGRKPRRKGEAAGPTVKLACDSFLTFKEQQRDNGEIQPRTFADLNTACLRIANAFGRDRHVSDLRKEDFGALRNELSKTLGLVALGVEIQRIRGVFKFALDDGIIDAPVRYGKRFDKPTDDSLRKERDARGDRDLTAEQIRAIIEESTIPLKAMILLGINAGFGNADCGTLPLKALDLDGGWVTFPRPKTGVKRRAKLWPETVKALRDSIKARPAPKSKSDEGLVFLTVRGARWAKQEAGNDPVNGEFKKVLVALGFHSEGIGFYSLRRSFETQAGDSTDQVATDVVMGHAPAHNDMAAVYRQRVNDARLEAVAQHVKKWLFPKPAKSR